MSDFEAVEDPWTTEAEERRRSTRARAVLAIRRTTGMVIALGIAYGIFHVVFRTDVLAPVLVYAEPLKQGIEWVIEDPRRAWIALAAIVVPHIGLYYLLFEDRK